MTRRAWSLRWVIGGIYFLIMATLLGALAIFFAGRTEQEMLTRMTRTLRAQAYLGADMLGPQVRASREQAAAGLHNQRDYFVPTMRRIFVRTGARALLIDLDGELLAEVPPTGLNPKGHYIARPEVQEALGPEGWGQDTRLNRETGEMTRFIAVPVLVQEAQGGRRAPAVWKTRPDSQYSNRWSTQAVLVLATPLTEVQTTMSNINTAITLAFIGGMLVLLLINAGVSNYISQPLATVSAAAERFARGDLEESVMPSGAAEIVSLGDSFNHMAEQLRGTISRLAEERAQAEAILASMFDGVLVTDNDGTLLLINRTAEQICGVFGPAIIGKSLTDAIGNDDLRELLAQTIDTRLPLKHEVIFERDIVRIVEVHLAPVEVDERQLGVVIVLYDITHQRKLEQVQRDFVANVSHELRTPVTSIKAMAETLLTVGGDDPAITGEFLETIVSESDRLTGLLDDLLHFSRVESQHSLLTPERLNLCELINHVTQRVIAPIAAKGQQLVIDMPEQLWLTGDRDALVQVLVNLLDNARKYSPEGSTITVTATQDEMTRVAISDTGIGIPAGELERIFERFYRVDKARSRAQGGTGLGLAIVKHLVELHAGRIFVESTAGVGSRFTVVFPQEKGETLAPEEEGDLASGAHAPVTRHHTQAGGG